jgi:hypothetical protein
LLTQPRLSLNPVPAQKPTRRQSIRFFSTAWQAMNMRHEEMQ